MPDGNKNIITKIKEAGERQYMLPVIGLPPDLKRRLDKHLIEGGKYGNLSEYVRDLIRRDIDNLEVRKPRCDDHEERIIKLEDRYG